MLDWIGSLRIRERSSLRVVLSLSHATQLTGWALVTVGACLVRWIWPISVWLLPLPVSLMLLGGLLVSLRRRLTLDREAGVLRVEQRAFGMGSMVTVPLFHLRAVVIAARPSTGAVLPWSRQLRCVAYLDRRLGDAIYLDEARRCAELLPMAEALAEVAELRLEYDATARASGGAG